MAGGGWGRGLSEPRITRSTRISRIGRDVGREEDIEELMAVCCMGYPKTWHSAGVRKRASSVSIDIALRCRDWLIGMVSVDRTL